MGELEDSDDRGCVLVPVALMGNARRSSAFDIPPARYYYPPSPFTLQSLEKGRGRAA